MDDLLKANAIAASGMKAQATRLRVVSENLANADSIAETPGGQPYRRKLVTFKNILDRQVGADTVRVTKIVPDKSEFSKQYDPGHPAADASGYVMKPNVNTLVEMMDMREAQRSYDANVAVISTSKDMLKKTIDMLR